MSWDLLQFLLHPLVVSVSPAGPPLTVLFVSPNGPPHPTQWSSLSPPVIIPRVSPIGPLYPSHWSSRSPLLVLPVSPSTLLYSVHPHVRCFNQIWRVLMWNYDILSFLIFVFIYLFLVTFCLISCDIGRSVWQLNFSFLARWSPKMPNEEDSSSQRHYSQINYLDWHHCVASWIFVNVWSTHVWH